MDGRTDGRMDRWTHVWKFTLVAYRTSALAAQKGKTSKCNSYVVVQNSVKFDKSFCSVMEYAAIQWKYEKN